MACVRVSVVAECDDKQVDRMLERGGRGYWHDRGREFDRGDASRRYLVWLMTALSKIWSSLLLLEIAAMRNKTYATHQGAVVALAAKRTRCETGCPRQRRYGFVDAAHDAGGNQTRGYGWAGASRVDHLFRSKGGHPIRSCRRARPFRLGSCPF